MKKTFNTSNTTNNIKRHNHNNYEHNVINKVHKHIKHINNYDTEINHFSKKSLNKKQYYDFYNDYFNFRKIENISLSQQTDITNNIINTNEQTINYIDNNYINNNNIASIIVNPNTGTDNYSWVPETSDNVVPGLDSLLTYFQSKYATLTSLQNSVNNMTNTINTEIQNLQSEIDNIQNIPGTGTGGSKNNHYHTSHTGFMYQRNNTKNDNRKSYVMQNHYFTFQRKGNDELAIQALNIIVADLQAQINNLSSNNPPSGDSGIGTS